MVLNKRAQSTLEYVIVLTAIIAVVLFFAGGILKTNVRTSLEQVGNQMQNQVNRITFNGK
jgi:Flp pilus assembly pilin Flp